MIDARFQPTAVGQRQCGLSGRSTREIAPDIGFLYWVSITEAILADDGGNRVGDAVRQANQGRGAQLTLGTPRPIRWFF